MSLILEGLNRGRFYVGTERVERIYAGPFLIYNRLVATFEIPEISYTYQVEPISVGIFIPSYEMPDIVYESTLDTLAIVPVYQMPVIEYGYTIEPPTLGADELADMEIVFSDSAIGGEPAFNNIPIGPAHPDRVLVFGVVVAATTSSANSIGQFTLLLDGSVSLNFDGDGAAITGSISSSRGRFFYIPWPEGETIDVQIESGSSGQQSDLSLWGIIVGVGQGEHYRDHPRDESGTSALPRSGSLVVGSPSPLMIALSGARSNDGDTTITADGFTKYIDNLLQDAGNQDARISISAATFADRVDLSVPAAHILAGAAYRRGRRDIKIGFITEDTGSSHVGNNTDILSHIADVTLIAQSTVGSHNFDSYDLIYCFRQNTSDSLATLLNSLAKPCLIHFRGPTAEDMNLVPAISSILSGNSGIQQEDIEHPILESWPETSYAVYNSNNFRSWVDSGDPCAGTILWGALSSSPNFRPALGVVDVNELDLDDNPVAMRIAYGGYFYGSYGGYGRSILLRTVQWLVGEL